MTTQPHSERWSFRHACQAARSVRRAEFWQQTLATVRPRGVVGFARRRAPLAIMLYLASWEGRLCWQDLYGFAVLEPPVRAGSGRGWARPADRGIRAEAARLRLLRLLDSRWDTVVCGLPLILALLATAVTLVVAPWPGVAAWCAAAGGGYLFALVVARAAASLRWLAGRTELAQLGALDPAERVAGARPADHWSMSLCHQARPERTDELLRLVSARLIELVAAHRASLRADSTDADSTDAMGTDAMGTDAMGTDAMGTDAMGTDAMGTDATRGTGARGTGAMETLVCLTGGITTSDVRSLVATSTMAVAPDPADGDVVVLLAPTYPVPAGRRDVMRRNYGGRTGGGFFAWHVCGLVVVSLANARFISVEAHVSYTEALRWLAGRLLFSDTVFSGTVFFDTAFSGSAFAADARTASLSQGLWGATALGWLTSLAGVTTVLAGAIAGRQYLAAHRERRKDMDAARTDVITRSRVLILVATARERDAVIDAVVARAGRDPIASCDGDRTVFALGKVGGADLLLVAQAGEGMARSEAGMGAATRAAIRLCRPDYVVLVGTCYGLRPDDGEQRIGDILVSLRVESLDRPRVADRFGGIRAPRIRPTGRDGSPDRSQGLLSRGVDLGPSSILLDRCRCAQRSWSRYRARIHFGLLLSSGPQGAGQSIGDLRKQHPDAIGGESGGPAGYEAAVRHRVPWVMVKAISDWGAGRSDEFEDIAARNAADFATHMVAIGSLPHP